MKSMNAVESGFVLIEYNTKAEVTYFTLCGGRTASRSVEICDELSVDIDAEDSVVGVDFLLPAPLFTEEHAARLDRHFPGLGTKVCRALAQLLRDHQPEVNESR